MFLLFLCAECFTHPQINPPQYIPLVEVIPASWTDPAIITTTVEILKGIGQAPVVAKKEINGFIVNRLQYALIMEAWRLVEVSTRTGTVDHLCCCCVPLTVESFPSKTLTKPSPIGRENDCISKSKSTHIYLFYRPKRWLLWLVPT